MKSSRPRSSGDPLPGDFAEAFEAVRPALSPLAHHVVFFNSTGSTNDVALEHAADPDAEGIVVIADRQTAGRGRLGRSWDSPGGNGLYVSIVLRPSRARVSPERATGLLTLAAGVALSEAVEQVTRLRPDIKWPNDLIVGRRKLAGILAESAGGEFGHIVLGFGINVGVQRLSADVDARATSLESELGRPCDRAKLCAASLAALAERYGNLLGGRFDAILDAWRARSPSSRGSRVTWNTPAGRHTGLTDGVDDRGALLVRQGDRVERVVGGEVTWL